jgi:predicted Zn-dependent peptidase
MSKPRAIEELKQRIKEEIATMAEQMTRRVMENLRERFEQCLRHGGGHLNDVLFKT